MSISRWREVVLVEARYFEPGLEPEDDDTLEVWRPNDNPNAGFVQMEMQPLWCGSSPRTDGYSLVASMADSEGRREFYRRESDGLKHICDAVRLDGGVTVSVLTVWDCEAGTTYIPGEPDEWDESAQLIGYLHPKTFAFVALED